jgi:hypothetical protein
MNPEEVFMLFVTAINRHDKQALTALMASDHIFTRVKLQGSLSPCSSKSISTRHFSESTDCKEHRIRSRVSCSGEVVKRLCGVGF